MILRNQLPIPLIDEISTKGDYDHWHLLVFYADERSTRCPTRREAAISLLYMNPIDEIFADPVRDQYGIEAYWRISLSNNIWITPGIHFIFNPSLNPDDDFVAMPMLKFRVAI